MFLVVATLQHFGRQKLFVDSEPQVFCVSNAIEKLPPSGKYRKPGNKIALLLQRLRLLHCCIITNIIITVKG